MAAEPDGQRCLLDIRHPDCRTLKVTEPVDAGLLGSGVYAVDRSCVGRFTASANSPTQVDLLAKR
jgi:hypothetical protein